MATETVNHATSAPIEGDRVHIARQAAWEIEALADCIIRELTGTEEAAARGIAIRVKHLACIQMGALSDDTAREGLDDLHLQLTGTHRAQEASHG